MKKLVGITIFIIYFSALSYGQSAQNVETKIKQVTVYLQGAQIQRDQKVSFPSGKSIVKFTSLSPYIDEKSIQVKAAGNFTILSVNRHLNYLNENKKEEKEHGWNVKIKELQEEVKKQEAQLSVLNEEILFLKQNMNIKGSNSTLTVGQLQEAAKFYRQRMSDIKQEELATQSKINALNTEINRISRSITDLYNDDELPRGEIWVNIDAKNAGSADFELFYLVSNASWFPSYDVRVNSISEPVNLVYKANVQQKTGEDWNNVKISFSTSDPKKSAVAPKLKPYYLNYNLAPPRYDNTDIGTVSGVVTGGDGEALPGVNVVVKGTTVGTVSDINGRYSLTLPNNAKTLVFSSVGYKTIEQPITQSAINLTMAEDISELQEMVVVGYGSRNKKEITGAVSSVNLPKQEKIRIRGLSTLPVEIEERETTTNVEFTVTNPYTIPADGKNLTIEMQHYAMPANYEYYSVPKITPDAFLLAYVPEWEKYNLLAGEAQLYYENTFMGKSVLDVSNAGDTLQLSLGVDKGLVINRELATNYTSRQFLGSKKEEERSWLIKVKNNKKQPVSLRLFDQVPVSGLEEIEVEIEETSGGKHNETNGEITWNINLDPGEQKELTLHYLVKYPKSRTLRIE